MNQQTPTHDRQPSRSWSISALIITAAAIAAAVLAVSINADAQRPIGEGQLFLMEGEGAATFLETTGTDNADLRKLRNELTIEAVSLVGADGVIVDSTSASLIGMTPSSPVTAQFAEAGRFGAIAAPVQAAIFVDGVQEWSEGDIVYEAVHPLSGGRTVLLTYDISELLARRSSASGVPTSALQLFGIAAGLFGLLVTLLVGRSRTARTYREFALEAEFLQRSSDALTKHNVELEVARERAERAYELAEETNRIRSEFVLMINHELRTPLTGVVTGAELLRSSGTITDPDWLAILDDVLGDGHRLSALIDQILTVARIENGALFFELHSTGLDDVFDRIKAGQPKFDLPKHVSATWIDTDPTTLINLIRSLANNAFSHGASHVDVYPSDTAPVDIHHEVGSRPNDPHFIVVEDNGPGINQDFLPRAFEKFEKDSRSSGTGLGLYIARLMVDALQGSLMVHTKPSGSCFAIALPRSENSQ